MNTEISTCKNPKIALMILFGVTGAASMGAVSAANAAGERPILAFKFDPHSLETASGARELYGRLQQAAEAACPAPLTGTSVGNRAIYQCREELVSAVVHRINNPRLVALDNNREKNSCGSGRPADCDAEHPLPSLRGRS